MAAVGVKQDRSSSSNHDPWDSARRESINKHSKTEVDVFLPPVLLEVSIVASLINGLIYHGSLLVTLNPQGQSFTSQNERNMWRFICCSHIITRRLGSLQMGV